MRSSDLLIPVRPRRPAWLGLCCASLAAAGLALPAKAQEQSPERLPDASPWTFSGFGTLGLVHKSGGKSWSFQRNTKQVGANSRLSATPDSRIGGQVNWASGEQWEATLQAVLLDAPSSAPPQESIQLAFIGYRPTSTTRIRLGRTSPDIFLFADSRNVGFALPWVRPPVDFYEFFPLSAIDGGDIEQRWSIGDAEWRAHAAAGHADSTVSESASGSTLHSNGILALSLTGEDRGLLVKASYLRCSTALDSDTLPAVKQRLGQLAAVPAPGAASTIRALDYALQTRGEVTYVGFGAQYETGPWTVAAEVSHVRVLTSALSSRHGYLSVGWRRDQVTYYGVASRVLPDTPPASAPDIVTSLTPVIGAEQALQAQSFVSALTSVGNSIRYDQSTLGVGLRWDVAPTAALKVQLDRFDVRRSGGGQWRNYDGSAGSGTLLSVALDFVVGQ